MAVFGNQAFGYSQNVLILCQLFLLRLTELHQHITGDVVL